MREKNLIFGVRDWLMWTGKPLRAVLGVLRGARKEKRE
jgi:hypothetical protein